MIKKNLFILRSPLQVINAIEAIKHFELKNNIVVLIYNSLDTNTKQINELIETEEWVEIIKLEDSGRSKLTKYVTLIKKLKKDIYRYLFLGDFGTIQRIIIPNITKEYVYLIDDGATTLTIYNQFLKPKKLNKFNFREFRYLFFGLKFIIRDKINLFTYFDLESIDENTVVKNKLLELKNRYLKDITKDNNIYFIGQPLDSVKILNVNQYVKVIEALIEKYNKKIIYIPHRSESQNLRNSVESIKSELFEIKTLNMPVEIYFLQEKIIPFKIVSFFSVVLITAEIILEGVDIDIIKIDRGLVENKEYYDKNLIEYYSRVKKEQLIPIKELI